MIRKLSQGNIGPDEIAELLATQGIDLEITHTRPEAVPEVFREAAIRTLKPGVDVITICGRMKNGDRLDALMIVQPKERLAVTRIERATYDALNRFDGPGEPSESTAQSLT
jgi:hypothetical protein